MTKKLVWRLKEQPTPQSLRELVSNGLLTKDEAREILFSSIDETDRSNESLKSEIKFLRELVQKLSESRSQIIITIKEVEAPYIRRDWYQPYTTWCDGTSGAILCANTADMTSASSNFMNIATF